MRGKKCSNCLITLDTVNEKLYCVSCKDWLCLDCLELPSDQLQNYTQTDLPFFCQDCSIDYYCPVCQMLCRDKCIYCDICEKFLHVKCTKLTRGQGQNRSRNFICHLCIQDNLPVGAVNTSTANAPSVSPTFSINSNVVTEGCGLCIECDTECLTCDLCPDLQKTCDLCLSCKYYDCAEVNRFFDTYDAIDTLLVSHVNARSLTANFSKIKSLLKNISKKPDIIGISETWLCDDSNVNLFDLPGYKFICKHSQTENSNIGGVGMYVSRKLKYKFRSDLSFNYIGCETEFIEVETCGKNMKNVIIGALYRHPDENHNLFYSHLSKVFAKTANKSPLVFCGDINIDTSAHSKSHVKDYKNLLSSYGCLNLINRFTRIFTNINGDTSKTIIDHMITNIHTTQAKSGVIQYEVADHLPIFSIFKLNIERLRQQAHVTRRFYTNSSKVNFMTEIKDYTEKLLGDRTFIHDTSVNPNLASATKSYH